MLTKIDHIAIVIKELDQTVNTYSKLLGVEPYHREKVIEQKVEVASLKIGQSNIELVSPLDNDSGIAKFLSQKGEGIHHICFRVDNIEAELSRLDKLGFQLIDKKPRIGAEGAKIAFLHPKTANGVLIELKEKKQ